MNAAPDGRPAAAAPHGAPVAPIVLGRGHVTVRVHDKAFAMPVTRCRRVLPLAPCTPVPGAEPHVAGLMGDHGRVVVVWDLAQVAGLGRTPPATGWVLVTDHGGQELGLLVDEVHDVAREALLAVHADVGSSPWPTDETIMARSWCAGVLAPVDHDASATPGASDSDDDDTVGIPREAPAPTSSDLAAHPLGVEIAATPDAVRQRARQSELSGPVYVLDLDHLMGEAEVSR